MENYLIKINDFSIKSENNICYIDFFSPTSKNAISLLLASLLKDILAINVKTQRTIFEDFLKEKKIVLVVLRSLVENIFASGGHLGDLLNADRQEHVDYGDSIRDFCKLLSSISIPSIAILAGNAYGGGVELALAPDFRWSIGKNIEFHFVQTKFGVPGGWGGMTRLAELCPSLSTKKVNSLFLAQDVLKLRDLYHMSLVDKTFDDEKACFLEINKWRDNIISCDGKLKEDFFNRNKVTHDKLKEFDIDFFQRYFLSENHKKNINNFLDNKRTSVKKL